MDNDDYEFVDALYKEMLEKEKKELDNEKTAVKAFKEAQMKLDMERAKKKEKELEKTISQNKKRNRDYFQTNLGNILRLKIRKRHQIKKS